MHHLHLHNNILPVTHPPSSCQNHCFPVPLSWNPICIFALFSTHCSAADTPSITSVCSQHTATASHPIIVPQLNSPGRMMCSDYKTQYQSNLAQCLLRLTPLILHRGRSPGSLSYSPPFPPLHSLFPLTLMVLMGQMCDTL